VSLIYIYHLCALEVVVLGIDDIIVKQITSKMAIKFRAGDSFIIILGERCYALENLGIPYNVTLGLKWTCC
jgi:hypothetical protein